METLKLRVSLHSVTKSRGLKPVNHPDREFPANIDGISVKEFEPSCPFCQKELKDAECTCDSFKKAVEKICRSLSQEENVYFSSISPLGLGDISEIIPIKEGNIKTEKMDAKNVSLDTFTGGNQENGIEISLGVLENRELVFFARIIASSEVYKFTISEFDYKKKEGKVYFYTLNNKMVPRPGSYSVERTPKTLLLPRAGERIGNYRIETTPNILKTMSYPAFLKELKASENIP